MSFDPKDFELNRRIIALGVQLERVQQTLADLAGEIDRLKAWRNGTPFESDAELVRLLIVRNNPGIASRRTERFGKWHECVIPLDDDHVAELYYDDEARRLIFGDDSEDLLKRDGGTDPPTKQRDSDEKTDPDS